ncbi:hypothetical protein M9H77_30841 [Catharanthus roseus]|uniref:Uncharacterized protein n=1 Tax=Catharanthus roseus TaxID=4058 RepID=A0ACC0A0F6_CATRO|nr:hypothetical protein M9H77_30841 [Catharanthus roseus]
MSGSQSPNHADKAVSESSQNRQSKPLRKATPRPKQATHKDALRVMFGAFRLQGMAKDWWLRASEARTLKNQPWTWNDFQEELKKEYISRWVHTDENKTRQFVKGLRVELQRALAPLPPMGFAAAIEAATRTEMADQAVIQGKTAIGLAATPYKRPGQGLWKPRDFKRSRGEQRTENGDRPILTPGGAHRVCT